jgi:hypothetical protein
MKFYRYLIYRLYCDWSGDIPKTKVILFLSLIHVIQLLSVFLILGKIFHQIRTLLNMFLDLGNVYQLIAIIFFFGLNHILFYDQKRWDAYVDEFKEESTSERKKRTILVSSYLIITFFVWFLLILIY